MAKYKIYGPKSTAPYNAPIVGRGAALRVSFSPNGVCETEDDAVAFYFSTLKNGYHVFEVNEDNGGLYEYRKN